MTCLRPCMVAYERDDSQKLFDHVAKQPAAPTKWTLEGSRGSCLPPWSPCSSPRSRSVRRSLRCGRSCPEAPPLRQPRLPPSPPSARDPLSLRRLGDPSRRAPLEALCHCSASTLLQHLQRFLRAFIVPRTGREHASCPLSTRGPRRRSRSAVCGGVRRIPPLSRGRPASWRWRRWPLPAPAPCPHAPRCVGYTRAR